VEYIIQFQYKGEGDSRPTGSALNDEEILAPDGKTIPIPNAGDSVTLTSGGEPKSYKVLTRHFGYNSNHCFIIIVVTDISDKERAARLSE